MFGDSYSDGNSVFMADMDRNKVNPFDMIDISNNKLNKNNSPEVKLPVNDSEIWSHPIPNYESNDTSKPKEKTSKTKSFFGSVNNFFRTIGIFTVLIILLISSLFAFILIKPDSSISKWVVSNSFLRNYFTIKDGENGSNSSIVVKQEEAKNISGLLGLSNNQDTFKFAQPENAKTTVQVVQDSLPSVLSLSIKAESSRFGVSNVVAGTGYIVSNDGLVVTNKHVIASKCSPNSQNIKVSALSHDQKAYDLELLSVDPIDDIAILKIKNSDNSKFTPVKFADSTTIPIGSDVVAIGNVLGQLQNTVTKGIVSGLNRTIETGSNIYNDECTASKVNYIDNLIQTDAAINRGNSGGPLFDSNGLFIGMNTLGTSDSQNIGFAISSNLILSDLNSYKANGKIVRPRLGIYSKPITELQKKEYSWLPVGYGELLSNPSDVESAVAKNSSAEKVGLQAGDIILEFNGEKLITSDTNPSPLRRMILSRQPGEDVELLVKKAISGNPVNGYQYDSQDKKITVKLGSLDFSLNNQN